MKKTLIIVDFQKDFANKKGSLYVDGSEKAEKEIIKYISKNYKDINEVIFTIDWHSIDHCSFKRNDGMWPVHCLQYSEGAGISDKLIQTCLTFSIPFDVFKKGNNNLEEEYGAFENISMGSNGTNTCLWVDNMLKNSEIFINTPNLVICGIAGDYCVKFTLENLLRHKNSNELNIEVLTKGIASIDGGTTIDNFIKENNLKTI